jgi:hypothetical protein
MRVIFLIFNAFLLFIHIIFVYTNVYGTCIQTDEKQCSLCVSGEEQYPCNCEYKETCKMTLVTWIIPFLMLIILLIALLGNGD